MEALLRKPPIEGLESDRRTNQRYEFSYKNRSFFYVQIFCHGCLELVKLDEIVLH